MPGHTCGVTADDRDATTYSVRYANLIDDTRGTARVVATGVVPAVTKVEVRPWDPGYTPAFAEVVVYFTEPPRTKVEPFSFGVSFTGLDGNGRERFGSDGADRLTSLQQIDSGHEKLPGGGHETARWRT